MSVLYTPMNYNAAYEAESYPADRGHRRSAHIAGPASATHALRRRAGYRKANLKVIGAGRRLARPSPGYTQHCTFDAARLMCQYRRHHDMCRRRCPR